MGDAEEEDEEKDEDDDEEEEDEDENEGQDGGDNVASAADAEAVEERANLFGDDAAEMSRVG